MDSCYEWNSEDVYVYGSQRLLDIRRVYQSAGLKRLKNVFAASRFIQKVECQIQEHSRTFPARHSHILFTILPTEQFRLMKHVYNVNLRRPNDANLTVTDNK